MTLNPSAGNGLEACSNAQIGYQPYQGKVRFSQAKQSCPEAAKIGSLEVTTPLLDHKLPGAIYVAKPFENPFGSLFAIYLALEDEQSGVVLKLAGNVTPDPTTGRLTASFAENPELPIEDIGLHFFNGPRAVFKTPLPCGNYTTSSILTPWSTPAGLDATPSDSFGTSIAAKGSGPCPSSEAAAPNTPTFTAGTLAPSAGAYSPFQLKITRADGTQRLSKIETTLPEGLTGKLAGIPYCGEAQIAQAKSREAPNQGAVEQASPSCPAASEIGRSTPVSAPASASSTCRVTPTSPGPTRAPRSPSWSSCRAVAGPFDLGAAVVRVALYVDPATTQIRAVSDAIPTILQGVPLDLRSIALRLDRSKFTLNPTSCSPAAVTGVATSSLGGVVPLEKRFQVGGCSKLGFKPKLALSLKGATKRSGDPALKAVLTQPKSQTNIGRVSLLLPRSEFIDQRHINNTCTRPQFNDGSCPANSILGTARAYSPLLDKPLEGPVYFRANGGERELPDLVAALRGQVDLNVVGFVDAKTKKGSEASQVRTTFASVPDAPVSKFVIELKGGKKGLLQNSTNLCKTQNAAEAHFRAQDGRALNFRTQIANSCKGGGGKKSSR